MQLEVGKRYVTRHGQVSGVLQANTGDDMFPFWDPTESRSYQVDGAYFVDHPDRRDLIEEYVEPVAAPVEDEFSYADMVRALKKSPATILDELNENDVDLIHMGIGVAGEAGELLDAVKRRAIYRKPLDRENVIEELGDLEFYMEGIRQTLQITREETLEANKRKLGERYKSKVYSDQAAQERADKVVPHEA